MKNKSLLFALAGVLLLCLFGFTYQGPSKPQYEYKVEYHGTISEKKLNELAAQNWELVAIQSPGSEHGVATFVFKRAK